MNLRRRVSSGTALAALVVTAAFAMNARAKSPSYDDEEPSAPAANAPPASSLSLAGAYGLPSLTAAMKSNVASVRVAAVERAAEVAQTATEPTARDAAWSLVEGATNAMLDDDPDGSLAVRLAAARALSKSPREGTVKVLDPLLRNPEPPVKTIVVHTPPWAGPVSPYGPYGPYPYPPSPYPYPGYGPAPSTKAGKRASAELVRYVRETAAMSLGALGKHAELFARLRDAKDDAETTRAVLAALVAFPAPQSPLDALQGKGEKIESVKSGDVQLLERLGDVRAADFLYAVAQSDSNPAGAALRALARLGDARAVTLAAAISDSARLDMRLAAAEALAIFGDSRAEGMLGALAKDPKAAPEAKRLAVEFPIAGQVSILAPLAAAGDAKAVAGLGVIGSAAARVKLVDLARDDASPVRDAAAYAIAVMPDGDLSAIGATTPSRKRRIVRAAAVRAARIGGVDGSLKSDAKSLLDSKLDADRGAGALLLSVLDAGKAADFLAGQDMAEKKAAVTALLSHSRVKGAEVARAHLAAHGASEDPDVVRALAGVAARAVDGSIARDVPISTSILAGWLAEDSPASPVAAFVLAARGGAAVAPHVARALASSSYDVRAAALLGLGVSPDSGASSLLASQIQTAARPTLRRAAVRALAARGKSTALAAIARLEPDAEARALAHGASNPKRTSLLWGREVIEVRVDGQPAPLASVTHADGFVVPVLVDPEGFVFAFNVPAGPSGVYAAPRNDSKGKP